MIYLLLILLIDAEEDVIAIFNRLDNDKKVVIIKLFKKIFEDEFNKEIILFKRIYKAYENKRVELTILHEFGIEQGFIKESDLLNNDTDYQIYKNFNNVDSLEDM